MTLAPADTVLFRAALRLDAHQVQLETVVRNELHAYTYAELLLAYKSLRDYYLSGETSDNMRSWGQQMLIATANGRFDAQTIFADFADVARTHPEDAAVLAFEVLRPLTRWSPDIVDTPYPGLLTRASYEQAAILPNYPHAEYLVGQLRSDPSLTSDQRDLGLTLAPEWVGTLESLLETLREM